MNTKKIIVAIALVAAVIAIATMGPGPRPAAQPPALAGEATASTAPQLSRTQEYRMWSAEQMTNRLLIKFGKMTAACNHIDIKALAPAISEACTQAVMNAYPRLKTIREIAASGDEVQWAILIDETHKMERGIEPALNDFERK